MAAITAKALVLGGKNGLLGQALVRVLEERGWSVNILSGTDIDYFSNNIYDE